MAVKSQYDVAIIGGGVIGVCASYYLARQGVKVLLIEKGEIASGCSSGNAGPIVPSHAVPLASPGALGDGLRWLLDAESPFYIKPRFDLDLFGWLARYMFASRESAMRRSLPTLRNLLFASVGLFEELSNTAGFYFGYEGEGSLWVCLSEERLERERREVDLLKRFKIPARVMTQSEVHDLEPSLLPGVMGGVFYPNDGHIDPSRFVTGLAEKAKGLGVEICTNTEVQGFETIKGSITSLRTNRGELGGKQFVLATGAWSPEIARALKLRIPIQAAKGYSITLKKFEPSPRLPLLLGEARVVVNPMGYALRLSGTLEMAGMDLSINTRRVEKIRQSATAYLPGVADARVMEIWRGLRPCTPDGLPILGRSRKFKNLIVATGHAMLGMSLGPITGKLVSQMVQEEKTQIDLSPMSMERF